MGFGDSIWVAVIGSAFGALLGGLVAVWIWRDQRKRDEKRSVAAQVAEDARVDAARAETTRRDDAARAETARRDEVARYEQARVLQQLADDLRQIEHDRESYDAVCDFWRELTALTRASLHNDDAGHTRTLMSASLARERLTRYVGTQHAADMEDLRLKYSEFAQQSIRLLGRTDWSAGLKREFIADKDVMLNLSMKPFRES